MSNRHLAALLAGAAVLSAFAVTPVHAQTHDDPDAAAARAQHVEARAEQVSRRVISGLDRARTSRDPLQTRCLDRTLTEVHAVLRMLRHQRRALDDANAGELRHRRTVLGVLSRRLTDLERQAMVCEGSEPDEARATTRVEVSISPNTPRIDPGQLPRPLPQRGPLWER